MIKFPFTPQGFTNAQEVLYQLDDAALLEQARSVAGDFISWVASHFELEVYLLEGLRNLPKAPLRQLGWCTASCLLARQPFVLDDYAVINRDAYPQSNSISFRMEFSASFISYKAASGAENAITLTIHTHSI